MTNNLLGDPSGFEKKGMQVSKDDTFANVVG